MKVTKYKTNHKTFVVDSSVFVAYLLPDEQLPPQLKQVFQSFSTNKEVILIAPPLLKYEFGNTLKSSVLRNRLNLKSAHAIFSQFLLLNIVYKTPNLKETLNLAIKRNLSVYDASYLQLALSHPCPLLSLDTRLQNLARD